ncbi:hypothetical protein [Aureimonas sp. D3]|uniref:hypothetical protein n=1 Tax=Aureimonas sp. D3 TaxID=1638164 RepID=UPI001AEC5CF9|nr:hypothetical protein [Aureimonas sp. D3]
MTNALHRRPWTRRLVLAGGYLGGAAALVYGGLLFWSGNLDRAMESGWWLVGGLAAWHYTAEAQTLSQSERRAAAHKPKFLEFLIAWTPFRNASTACSAAGADAQARASPVPGEAATPGRDAAGRGWNGRRGRPARTGDRT